ncbi:MAG: 30S ribosomal protein S3 [candidate division WS6 bacterium 34_10]|jgi:small subunit ribosomal protein S3|uniref:Small ribosomal subunit protein uS3 n=1 Tax=candidate division WS6 bacterium 34_10 TaxID=1641389 RepID=A0A101HG49_9BACT|nr:MAG: 30S ribosomal protein S3 [candidate division WS6 bacterium 34_10]
MGRKVHPKAIRMGINRTWDSMWYASKKDFPKLLQEDLMIKKKVSKVMNDAGLDSVQVKRGINKIEVVAFVARPGVAIGRGGEGIDALQKELRRLTQSAVELKVREVNKADLSARIVARTIADGIERRQPSKFLVLNAKEKIMQSGAKGLRIWVSGRINNASQARTVKVSEGSVPAQTLKADVDYASEIAQTADAGLMGVKVWIYRGDKTEVDRED